MAQQISSKEQTLFRQLVKFYEAKQHNKALKTADQILKKNPDYADAIAMKVRLLIPLLGRFTHINCLVRPSPSMAPDKQTKHSHSQRLPYRKAV